MLVSAILILKLRDLLKLVQNFEIQTLPSQDTVLKCIESILVVIVIYSS
jgi:hypothetical protein